MFEFLNDTSKRKSFLMCCVWTLLFSFVAHGYSYFHFMPQSDAIMYSLTNAPMGEVVLGRYLIPLYYSLVTKYSVPLMTGIISAVFLGITVYLISDLFELNTKWEKIVLAGLLTCNASVTEINSTFQYTLGIFTLAIVFAIIGTYIILKTNDKKHYLVSFILFVLSMGLYQGEILAAAILFIIYAVKELLENKEIKKSILKGIQLVAVLLISGITYYAIYKILLSVNHLSVSTGYNSFDNVMKFQLDEFLVDTKANMIAFGSFFFGKNCFIGTGARIANILLFVTSVIAIIFYIRRNKTLKPLHICLMVILILSLPFFSTALMVAMKLKKIRYYVCLPMFLCYILPLVFFNLFKKQTNNNKWKNIIIFLSFVIIFQNCTFSNKTYTIQQLLYDRTVSLMTQIESDLCDVEGYIPGETKVVAIGRLYKNEYLYDIASEYSHYVAFDKSSVTYTDTLKTMSEILGLPILCEDDMGIIHTYEQEQDVLDMPSFPIKGYIQKKDDIVIIKLSYWTIDEY